jgi:arsenite methyltransferase
MRLAALAVVAALRLTVDCRHQKDFPVASDKKRTDPPTDVWSDWLLHSRHAGDPAYADVVRTAVAGFADRVLDGARLSAGMTLADVGAGEGLVAFRAIERVGPSLRVALTDISVPMLRHAESLSIERGVRSQCTFHECSADQLAPLADASVDVVITRSVLAYVSDKSAALREFFRVLKPGGRISLYEPILQDEAFYARVLRDRVDGQGGQPADRLLTLVHRWKAAQFPDTAEQCAKSPIANYSERDLFYLTRTCGFTEIHLELHIDATPSLVSSWDVFLGTSPHPWAPPLARILAEQFTLEERDFFERSIRPIVEAGKGVTIDRGAYLNAVKPAHVTP